MIMKILLIFFFFSVVSNAPSPGSTSDEGSAPSTPRPMSPSSPERGNSWCKGSWLHTLYYKGDNLPISPDEGTAIAWNMFLAGVIVGEIAFPSVLENCMWHRGDNYITSY